MVDPDRDTVENVLRGDTGSYRLLVESYQERAILLALRMLGTREEAEEIVQDAFVSAYRSLSGFRGDSRFSTWLYRIVYNLCLTTLRRRRRRWHREGKPENRDMDPERQIGIASDDPTTLEVLEEADVASLVRREVERLPDRYRIPLTMFYLEEMSYETVAGIMGQPLGTVKTNLFRARTMLRERLQKRYAGEVRAA
jgi:RNA polymerase sigma-70 factor (ECF subfamily)